MADSVAISALLCFVLAAAMLVSCAYMYRLGFLLRAGILATPPLLVLLRTITAQGKEPIRAVLMCLIQCALAALVAWSCRPVLRGFVRVCCPNVSRGVFAGLWAVDGAPISLAPW